MYKDGVNKYFYFRLHRYNYDAETDDFLPGEYDVGKTIGSLCVKKGGLIQEDVHICHDVVGSNMIYLRKHEGFCPYPGYKKGSKNAFLCTNWEQGMAGSFMVS